MDGMSLSPGWRPISRALRFYLDWAHTNSPCHTSSTFPVPVRLLRKLFFTPVTHLDVLYFLYLDPVTRLYLLHPPSVGSPPSFALYALYPHPSWSLSPTHLCSKPHLLSIRLFYDDCIAVYFLYAFAPYSRSDSAHRQTSALVIDTSRYPCTLTHPRHHTTLIFH